MTRWHALLTSMVAVYGAEAIAAYGSELNRRAVYHPGLTGALSPLRTELRGQLKGRIRENCFRFLIVTDCGTGYFAGADHCGSITDDPKVADALSTYLWLYRLGMLRPTVRVATSAFNAVDHAFRSIIVLLRSLFIAVPTAGCHNFWFTGGVLGLVVAAFISSLLGTLVGRVDQPDN